MRNLEEAKQLIDVLGLKPHPTMGYAKETYRSRTRIDAKELPSVYTSSRCLGMELIFMVTPDARIKLHRIREDQMYHFYRGEPLEVLLLYPDGRGEVVLMGPDLEVGQKLQLLIPANTFHVSRVWKGGSYSLLGTSEWLGVEPSDVELGDPGKLVQKFPKFADQIMEFAHPAMTERAA